MIELNVDEALVKDVCYYLGTNAADEDESAYVKSLIEFAYADLYEKTRVNWLEKSTTLNGKLALEIVRSKVFLSYYGNRDDAKNTAHLEKYIASKTFSLMYSEEAVKAAAEDHNGSQT